MITQPFLKEENDNNHRRACHGKQPRGCVCEPVNLLLLRGISWVWFKGRPAPCHVSCESESGWELEAGLSLRVYLTRTWLPRETCQGPGVPGESPMDLSWLWFPFSSSVFLETLVHLLSHSGLTEVRPPTSAPCVYPILAIPAASVLSSSGCLQGLEMEITMLILERKKVRLR